MSPCYNWLRTELEPAEAGWMAGVEPAASVMLGLSVLLDSLAVPPAGADLSLLSLAASARSLLQAKGIHVWNGLASFSSLPA